MSSAIAFFLIGFFFLIKGGDWFVTGAAGIARRFNVPELLIGATIVSIGTTLPEVMVSLGAALKGSSGISYGNAIGSVICNTSLIAAITIAVRPERVSRKSLLLPTVFFFGSAIFYSLNACLKGGFSRIDGVILLFLFMLYMLLTVRAMTRPSAAGGDVPAGGGKTSARESTTNPDSSFAEELTLLVIGAILIAIGANLLVDNGTLIASYLGVPESVIGLTLIALGTSLPELVTAITSLIRGHGALSLGNVIGANLLNIVLVAGLSVTVAPFSLPAGQSIAGINSSLIVDLPLMLIVMAILTLPALIKERLYRVQGILLLLIYALFTVYQLIL